MIMTPPTLKPGWKLVNFGDVVRNANLTERDPATAGIDRIVGLEHIDPENLHIRRWGAPEDNASFTRKFVPGQTLFGKRRAYQRKVAYAEFKGICSGDILTFEPINKKVLLPELLPFICQTDAFFDYALGTSAGSLSPRTSWGALKEFEFPLPPINEQKRIAEILWAADEAVENFKVANQKLDFLGDMLISKYLKNTPKVKLSDTGEWTGGGTPSKANKDYWSGNIPWVSPKDLKENELFDVEDHISETAVINSSTKVVPAGSMLIAVRTGILRHTFPVVIIRNKMAINQDLKALIPNDEFLPEYVAGFLRYTEKQILRECVKSGTTVESVDFSLLKSFSIPKPELADQIKYLGEITKVKEAKQALLNNIETINRISKSLLDSCGEHDV